MMNSATKTILKDMLKEIGPYIEGRWILSDGGLLGLTRGKDLLDHDNDLDIYLFPNSYIKLPDDHPTLGITDYYMERKIYRKNQTKYKPNLWKEYVSYTSCLPEAKGMNRAQLFKLAKEPYKTERIIPEFSLPYIDVFQLQKLEEKQDIFTIPIWTEFKGHHFKVEELQDIQINMDLGFAVPVPNKADDILERLYGPDWRTENKTFQY